MLTDSAMAEALIGAVRGRTTFTAPSVYTSALASYVIQNIEITGVYEGAGDPLSGPVSLEITFPNLISAPATTAFLAGRMVADPAGFVSAVMSDANGAIVNLIHPYVGTSTGVFTAVSPNLDALRSAKTMEEAWLALCSAFVSSFRTLQIVQPIPTTTTSPGIGVTTGFTVL